MPYEISEFPVEYLNELDQVLMHETYANRYFVQGAEFVGNRVVKVPTMTFPDATINDYSRFGTENSVKTEYTPYTLGYDKEASFYLDAVDVEDEPPLTMSTTIAEWLRQVFNPYVDQQFFRFAASKAADKGTVALTEKNIKAQIRKVRKQYLNAGLAAGDLYMTPDTKALLEDATDRQWSSESSIYDTIGVYDGFNIIETPDDVLGCDFLAIAGGQQTIRHIVKRSVSYLWAPGSHTKGDGYLAQMRWVFGDIVRKNRTPGIYVHASGDLTPPEHDYSPLSAEDFDAKNSVKPANDEGDEG